MTRINLLFNSMQNHSLNLKINTFWRLQYYLAVLGKKKKIRNYSNEKHDRHEKPLLYSCSGCSSAAQMANYIAIRLHRQGIAEMSCIAGVGGNVKKLVHTASSGRRIFVIDGCPLACSKACLGNHSIHADSHFELTTFGVKKKDHEDFNMDEADRILKIVQQKVTELPIEA